jgi:hypothetical protein
MDEDLKGLLDEYVATANSGKYKSLKEVNAKFPELKGYDAGILEEYVATANSGKYKTLDEVNAKFPEFFPVKPAKQNQTTDLTSIANPKTEAYIPTPLVGKGQDKYLQDQLQPKIRQTQPTLGRDYLGDKKEASKIQQGIQEQFLPFAGKDLRVGEFDPNLEGIGAPILPANQKIEKSEGIGGKQILDSKPAEEVSIGESLGNSFSNFVTTLKTTFPATSIAANQLLAETFDTSILDFLDSIPRVEYDEDGFSFESKTRDEVLAENTQRLEQLGLEYKETIGLVDSAESGNIPRLAAGIVGSVTGLLATLVQTSSSGGSLLLTSMIGGGINDYNSAKATSKGITIQQLYDTKQADLKVPVIIASVGYGLEKVGLKSIQKLINQKIAKEGFRKAATLALEWKTEAATEWLSVGLDAANKSIASGKKGIDVSKDVVDALFSKQGLESYLTGFASSAGAVGGGKLIKRVLTPLAKKAVAGLAKKQDAAIVDLQNASNNPDLKDAILESIEENAIKIEEKIDEDRAKTVNLTEQQKKEVINIGGRLETLDTALEEETISEDTKALLTTQKTDLEKQLTDILNTKNQTQDEENVKNADGQNVQNGQQDEAQGGKSQGKNDGQNEGQNELQKEVVTEEVSGAKPTTLTPAQQVVKLRADEQAELAAAIPNIEDYKVNGVVDEKLITDEADLAKYKEIYDNYYEPITAAIREANQTTAGEANVQDVEIDIPKNLFQAIKGGEKTIASRKAQVLKEFRQAKQKATSGLNVDAATKALEYAVLTIADGSIKSAKALAKALGISNVKDVEDIYTKANTLLEEYNKSKVAPSKVTLKQSIKAATEAGISGETTISNKAALKGQIKTLNRGINEGITQQKQATEISNKSKAEIKKQVIDFLNSYKKTGLFNGVKIPATLIPDIVNKLDKALGTKGDYTTAMMNFSEYLENIIDDVDRTKKENVARQEANKIKGIANSGASKGQILQNPILKAFARIGANPSKITDIDNYNAIAAQIDKNGITVSNKDLQDYIDKEVDAQAKIKETREKEIADLKEANLKARIQELLDEAGIEEGVDDFYQSEIEYRDAEAKIAEEKAAGEVKETLTDKLKKVIDANRQGLPSNTSGLSSVEAQTLDALRGLSLEGLTPAQLKQLNTAITNAVVNGDFITATMDISQKFIQEQELPKWVKFYQDGLRKLKKGKVAGRIIQGTGDRSFRLTPRTGRGNTNQLFRAISNNGNVGQELYDLMMSPMMRGKTKAKQILNEVKTGILKTSKGLNTVNRTRIGDAGYLLNFELDGRWVDRQEAFESKKQELEDGVVIIEDKIRQSKQNMAGLDLNNLVQELKDKNESLAEIRKYNDVETFQKEFLTPAERNMYDFIIKAYEQEKAATQLHYRRLGIKFTDSENYFPTTFGGLRKSKVTADTKLGIDSYMGTAALDNNGGFVAERVRRRGLPTQTDKTSGLVVEMYVKTDALLNFNKEFGRRIIDIETMEGRVRAKHFLAAKELQNLLDGVELIDGKPKATIDNMSNIYTKVDETVGDILGTTPFSQDIDGLTKIIVDKITTGFFNTALGSSTQLVSQSIPSVPVVIAQTSAASWGASAMIQLKSTTLIYNLMKASNADAFGRLSSPLEQILQEKIGNAKDEYQNGVLRKAADIQEFSNRLNFTGLTGGDNINTTNAWMAGYIQYLKDNNLVDAGTKFDKDFMDAQVNKPNLKASAYADMIASTVNAAMDTDTRATNLKKRSATARAWDVATGNVLKGFTTSFNFEARLSMRSIFNGEGTAKDYKFLASYATSLAILSPLVKYFVGEFFIATVKGVTSLAGDDEEDERLKAAERRSLEKLNIILTKEEKAAINNMKISPAEKSKKRAELIKEKYETVKIMRKAVVYLTQSFWSVIMGSKQGFIKAPIEYAVDRAYNYVVESQFQEGFDNVQQKISYAPQTLFFTSPDNLYGGGLFDGLNESIKQAKKFSDGKLPLDDDLIKQLQVTRAMSAFVQIGLVIPYVGDAKRITDIQLRQLEELAKDGYYNMPKSYGFVRDAINRYDLEPIKPYNTKELTLKNNKEVIQVVKLTEDNLKKINEDAGVIIKTLMDLGDKSLINLGTSLETFNKNDLPLEKIKTSLNYRANLAKQKALDKFIKENYTGFKKISKQKEEED